MDTRFLRSFLCIAETGSLSRAATALNVVQPALSRQIRILEEELGTQLLVRHRRGIALTEAGHLLHEHATAILSSLETAKHAVSAAGGEPSGRLRVGLPTSMLYVLSAELIAAYHKRYPRVELQVFEAQGHVLETYIRDGKVDASILISPKPMSGIALQPLVTEGIYLAGSPEANLSMSKSVSLADIASLPMLMFPAHNKVRGEVEVLLSQRGLTFRPVAEVEGQPLTLELVRRGVGYTILPYSSVVAEVGAGRLSGSPIAGARLTWVLGLQRARAGAPAIRALVDMLLDMVREQLATGRWANGAGEAALARPLRRVGAGRPKAMAESAD